MSNGLIAIDGKVYPFPPALGTQLSLEEMARRAALGEKKTIYGIQIRILPYTGRKLVEEVPYIVKDKKVLYEINDASAITGLPPETLAHHKCCGKIGGEPYDENLYIDLESVKRFYRRIGKVPSFFRLRLTFIHLLVCFN